MGDKLSNPGPLGLMAFGMSTVLLNLHNAGVYHLGTMILAMGLCYGGIAQIIAGIMEYKKGNTFGTTAFISFGSFWLTLVVLLVSPGWGWGLAPETEGMVAYFSMWGLFTLLMFIATLRISRSLQVVFLTLVILFGLLALRDATGNEIIGDIAGYEGIFCGLSAIYGAIAPILNEVHGRTILPLGIVGKKWERDKMIPFDIIENRK